MSNSTTPTRIGICGTETTVAQPQRSCALWPAGYRGNLTAAGAEPVELPLPDDDQSWEDVLTGVHGVVLAGSDRSGLRQVGGLEALCQACRARKLPLLAIDHGLHVLNAAFGGSLYLDLPRELPEALQHRHPPEHGLRHMINVLEGTRLASIYGEGEIIVNSEHRRAVQRLARGFRVSAQALDGVIEAVEAEADGWFALGVQWHPASATASGLDIQLFRALVDAAGKTAVRKSARRPRRAVAA